MRSRQTISYRGLLAGLALLLTVGFFASGHALSSTDRPFAGRRIQISVGFPPGGAIDIAARILARHLPKHIPGNPSVIVRNMPGASGRISMTYLYNRAKPDGLTFGIATRSIVLGAILENVDFDLTRMPALWGVNSRTVDVVRDFLKARTAEELLKVDSSSIVISGRTVSDPSCMMGRLAMDLLEIKGYRRVCAYPGIAVIRAAMERGEVSYHGTTEPAVAAGGPFGDMRERGLVIPIWQGGITLEGKIARAPTPILKDVPTFYEVYRNVHGKAPSGTMWEAHKALAVDSAMLHATFVLPPGTPADRIALLRRAMARVTEDPGFRADWERTFGDELADVSNPAETAERAKNEFLKPAPWHDFLRRFIKE